MIDTIHAVTWSQHYCMPDIFVVKICKHAQDTLGRRYWGVTQKVASFTKRVAAYQTARKIACTINVPLIKDVKRNTALTRDNCRALHIRWTKRTQELIDRRTHDDVSGTIQTSPEQG